MKLDKTSRLLHYGLALVILVFSSIFTGYVVADTVTTTFDSDGKESELLQDRAQLKQHAPIHSAQSETVTRTLDLKAVPDRVVLPASALASSLASETKPSEMTSQAVRVVVMLTGLALVPAMLICTTSFLRIIIVLSMLRHAIGMQETPPNMALIGLALFLTLFTMSAPLQKMNTDAVQPFMEGKLSMQSAFEKANGPMREFMIKQTREQDLALLIELAKAPQPESIDDVSNLQLIPAFMLSELRAAFQIGFVIFLPFLLIDLVVSSILMALGMMMMPPVSISLPLKVLMFVLVDGWSLILKALVGSFH